MIPCRIERAAAAWRWACSHILPGLPVPGSKPFGELIRQLEPFGLNPQGVVLESPPGGKLMDLALNCELHQGRIRLRFDHQSALVEYRELLGLDIPHLEDLAAIAHGALTACAEHGARGRLETRYMAHWLPMDSRVDAFLARHLSAGSVTGVAGDGFSFLLRPPPNANMVNAKVAFANSIHFEGAIFIDLGAIYNEVESPGGLLNQAVEDTFAMLRKFGLTEEQG